MDSHTVNPISVNKYTSWVKLINENRVESLGYDPAEVVIDLTNINFLRPHVAVSMACLIEEYHQRGKKVLFKAPHSKTNIAEYLKSIKFLQYWNDGFNRDNYTDVKIGTNLCLWHISEEMINSYIWHAQNYFEQNHFNGKDLFSLNISLSELFNNIFDHSRSEISGYTISQYYPSRNVITIAVCDFGVGIPARVNEFLANQGKNRLSDIDAIQKAFELRFSTKTKPHNRGNGLDNLLSNLKNKGALHLFSNGARLSIDQYGNRKEFSLTIPFNGTLVLINLDCTSLPPIEEEIEIDEINF